MCTRKHRADSRWLTTAHINDANQRRKKYRILFPYSVMNVCHCQILLNPPSIGSRLPCESGPPSQGFFASDPNVSSQCCAQSISGGTGPFKEIRTSRSGVPLG